MISPVNTWVSEKTGLGVDLNDQSLRKWQHEKLVQMVQYAREKTRFYRDLPEVFSEITELPFTTPADIVADPLEFLAIPPTNVERITTLTTSGTTGERKRIFFSVGDIDRIREYFAVGMRSLTQGGWHAQILISDETVNSLGYLLRQALETIGVSSSILSPVPSAGAAVEASKGADCLVGMPGELLYMCRTEPGLRPKSVLLTADHVPSSVIHALREIWKCDVFTHYGMTETGFGYAVDCGFHEGHHTRDADILVEIVDPVTKKTCKPGEVGEIVLTMLSNEAMPLIRYRTGDSSSFIEGTCKCGATLSRLARIKSRYEDSLEFADGKCLDIHILDEFLFAMPMVRGFTAYFIQEENSLYLVIDSFGKVDPKMILPHLPSGVRLILRYGPNDPFTHRGKRRLFRDINPSDL